jgi:NitT/TauT family transport system substrate-binding protein
MMDRRCRVLAATSAAVLLLVSCGDDDAPAAGSTSPSVNDEAATSTDPSDSEPSGTDASSTAGDAVTGCDGGWTDPADLSSDRQVARCEPGSPAPQPLDEMTDVRVAITTTGAEYVTPMLMAVEAGEFEKENLDVELEVIPPTEALNVLAQGRVQVWLSSADAAFHNAVDQGYRLAWVAGNFFEQPTSKSGLWIRNEEGSAATADQLRGKVLATVSGAGSVITYPIAEVLNENDLAINDVEFKTYAAPDVVSALQNGAVSGAWLLTPAWQQVDGDEAYTFVAGQPPGEPLGGIAYGADLLDDRPEVGEAFLRAYIRTINTYFNGDYKSDPAFVEQLSTLTEVPVESLEETDELVFDWEIREGTSGRMQEVWHQTEALSYDGVLDEDLIVDRRFANAAVGHADG